MHDDLLAQAKNLVAQDPRRPKQVNLRRGVSSAYYGLYHLLVSEAANLAAPAMPTRLRWQVRRAFAHKDMNDVCKQFAQGKVESLSPATGQLITGAIEPELMSIADTFVELQEARHNADYDLWEPFSRVDARKLLALAEQAFAAWRRVRNNPNAKVFLSALLLQKRWSRKSGGADA